MEESSRYALTYPQLVLQAAARGYDQAALSRLKRGHAFTLRVVDGRYRAQDVPFLCHLVRSASIAMWHGASEDVVLASLAHAVYAYGARRRAVADAIGPSAEKLVHAYEQSELFDERFLRERIANHASLSQMERDVMLMAFANELEDFLDQQMAFRAGDRYRETIAGKGALRVKLARLLGHAALADEIERAYRRTLDEPVPVEAKTTRVIAYRLSDPRFLDPNNRLRAWIWQRLKR